MKSAKNGKIELLRFLFCISIIFYHINFYLIDLKSSKYFNFFHEGRIGVEFFFLVTGYLTASSVFMHQKTQKTVGENTWIFMAKKIKTVFPYHIIICILAILYRNIMLHENFFTALVNELPNIFFLRMTGISYDLFNGVEWYLSSMFLMLLILYPLCHYFYDTFTHIIAPFVGVISIGYIIRFMGALGNPTGKIGIFYAGNVRALGLICLGMFSFELFRVLQEQETVHQKRILFTVIEITGYLFVLLYMTSNFIERKYGGMIAIILCILVGISFSELPYGQSFFNNRLFYFLGKCSLPIFLSQNLFLTIGNDYLVEYRHRYYMIFVTLGTIITGVLILLFVEWLRKRVNLYQNRKD